MWSPRKELVLTSIARVFGGLGAVAWLTSVTTILGCGARSASEYDTDLRKNSNSVSTVQTGTRALNVSPESFVGQGVGELIRKLGRPSRISKSDVTGGAVYLYTYPNQPHYLFEIDATNRVRRGIIIP